MGVQYSHVTKEQRAQIEALLRKRISKKEIAEITGLHLSTIYREIRRGSVVQRDTHFVFRNLYKYDYAHEQAALRAENSKPRSILEKVPQLKNYIEVQIKTYRQAPDIIAEDLGYISTATIYNYIHKNQVKVNSLDLNHGFYRKKKRLDLPKRKNRKDAGRCITQRPAHINDRRTIGHWEMDTVVSKSSGKHEVLLVLTERKTYFQIIRKIKGREARYVERAVNALERQYGDQFPCIFKSITCDNGAEFVHHRKLERSVLNRSKLRTLIYYARPYRSGDRGRNENQNRIIRRFFPKGTLFETVHDYQIKQVETYINDLRRRSLGYKSATQLFYAYFPHF